MPKIAASPALSRFRILDLSRVRAGPTCVKQFADFGADVIKIESPPGVDPNEGMGGPRQGPDFQNLHRNKRAMTLNLKLPEAREVFGRLVKTADVVVENYRPDVKYRLGIDYESLEKLNARIILASISGFGMWIGDQLVEADVVEKQRGANGAMNAAARIRELDGAGHPSAFPVSLECTREDVGLRVPPPADRR